MKKVLVAAIFVLFAVNAFAQSGYDYMYPEPTKKIYMDLSLGGFMPNGSYYDTSVTPPAELDLSGSVSLGIGINYYMNDYIGIDFMMAFAGAESEKYNNVAYADVSIFYLGGGLAARYKISKFLEIYANAGVALASASYSLEPSSSNVTSEGDTTIAGYIDGGVRIFPGSGGTFYILGDARFIAAGKAEYDTGGGDIVEIGLSGLMISVGVGMAF